MEIAVLTNDNHLFLLNGFQHLWNKYCGLPATIYGFASPNNLHPNFNFVSLGEQLPASQWSDGLLKMLDLIEDDYFVLMLEDYWLYEQVDKRIIEIAQPLLSDKILRIDLSGNRASYRQHYHFTRLGSLELVETPDGTPYQMSFQAAIWHKENLRKVLKKGENPWQAEVEGSKRVGNLRVLGTKPAVLKYQPVWRSKQKRWQLDKLKTEDVNYLRRRRWL